MKDIKTSIERDINNKNIEYIKEDKGSDLIKAIEILRNPTDIESNTILTNEQVNALSLMNWASQVYEIDFFKHYVSLFPRYRISGDDGRGRKEIIQIAEAIQREKMAEESRIMDMIKRK
jgi:hypothetical protein